MRLSPSGKSLMGVGGVGVHVSVDGVVPAPLAAMTIGGAWQWLDTADDVIAGQGDIGAGFLLRQYVLSTLTLSVLDSTPSGVTDASTTFRAGGNKWASFLAGGILKGVRSTVLPPESTVALPMAALGDIDDAGNLVVVLSYASDLGLRAYTAGGSTLWSQSVKVVDGGNRLRLKDGAVAYQDPSSGWHLRSLTTGALLPFAPRTDATVAAMVPVSVSGILYVVELTSAALSIRPATSSSGFVLATSANLFNPDAVELSAGVVRVGWSVTTGEAATDLRLADLTIQSGATSGGSSAGGGGIIVTPESPNPGAAFTVGPVEGGGATIGLTLPQHEPVVDTRRYITTPWYGALLQTIMAAGGPIDMSRLSGTLGTDQGGTGGGGGIVDVDGANILDHTVQYPALATDAVARMYAIASLRI